MVRTTFIIDAQGMVEKVMPKVKPDANAGGILDYPWQPRSRAGALYHLCERAEVIEKGALCKPVRGEMARKIKKRWKRYASNAFPSG